MCIVVHLSVSQLSINCRGAVIALVISEMLLPFMVIGYVWIRKLHKQTWGGWSWESLNQWGQYLKLAVPGLLMTCFEWWSAEITTFVAGSINEIELASNSVWFQTMVILYMVGVLTYIHDRKCVRVPCVSFLGPNRTRCCYIGASG